MRLSIKAMSSVSALLWGDEHSGCVFDAHRNASLRNEVSGRHQFDLPRLSRGWSLSDASVGTGYAIVDGGVGGFVLAWLYNALAHT